MLIKKDKDNLFVFGNILLFFPPPTPAGGGRGGKSNFYSKITLNAQ